jgi:anti-sigma regulatory factor (Ser/Thr protein kinase)
VREPIVDSAVQLRRLLRELLRRWELPDDTVDDAVLITTELATNAIVHAGTTFHVVVELQGRLLRIAVIDGCTRPPRRRTDRGLGLRIVTRTALRWGWWEYDTGKTVWAEVFV